MKALIFPGQGSQEIGMGRELYDNHPEAREVFEAGKIATGRDITDICGACGGGAEVLNRTENAQLAVFAVSMAALAVWRLENALPAAVAGFSLGEISALCAAEVVSLEDGFRLVMKRAEVMMAACEKNTGAMSAILGGDEPKPYESGDDWAIPVNYNCPGQVVFAGTIGGVAAIEEAAKSSGARIARLPVSGAFHTKMMAEAAAELRDFAKTLTLNSPNVPFYTNLTGEILQRDADVPAHIERQMTSPVLWQKTIENMSAAGITEFIETGHGSTLTKFIKRIKR